MPSKTTKMPSRPRPLDQHRPTCPESPNARRPTRMRDTPSKGQDWAHASHMQMHWEPTRPDAGQPHVERIYIYIYIYIPRKPTTKDVNAGATATCATCRKSTPPSKAKCVICKGLIKPCSCTRTMAVHGPPHIAPGPTIPQNKTLSIATGYNACDAATAALRTRPTNFNQPCGADSAPNPTDFCRANYHEQMHHPSVYLHPAASLSEIGVFILGPPCQDYSSAGKGKALSANRECLWFCSALCLLTAKPRVTILEKIVGITNKDNGKLIWITTHILRQAGYCATWAVLDTKPLGLPQSHNRLYLIASTDQQDYERLTWPETIEPMTIEELLDPKALRTTPAKCP